jgi:glycerophosphoryl diester phosphodiesterase
MVAGFPKNTLAAYRHAITMGFNPERPRDDLAELVRLGVNGILTDVPELFRDLLAAPTSALGPPCH